MLWTLVNKESRKWPQNQAKTLIVLGIDFIGVRECPSLNLQQVTHNGLVPSSSLGGPTTHEWICGALSRAAAS